MATRPERKGQIVFSQAGVVPLAFTALVFCEMKVSSSVKFLEMLLRYRDFLHVVFLSLLSKVHGQLLSHIKGEVDPSCLWRRICVRTHERARVRCAHAHSRC